MRTANSPTPPQKHRIALIGFGTVAKGLCQILEEKRTSLQRSDNFEFEVVAVATRSRGCMYHPEGLPLDLLNRLAQTATPFDEYLMGWDAPAMIKASNASIIIELAHTNLDTAEPARTHCRLALENGKHVISANKGPAALFYTELKALADSQGLFFLNEATVLSGTPVFSLLNNTLAGNTVTGLRAILNGTTNFILSEMERGKDFQQALEIAHQCGYLEADRSADIDGYDAQAKLAILANVLGAQVKLSDIKCEGISDITSQRVLDAWHTGKRWKLIASLSNLGDKVTASVRPELLDLSDPLAQVSDTQNALSFSTDLLGDITITGPGAGSVETGYGILSDLLTLNKEGIS